MKKSLLFALAALAVMSADAQVVSRAKQARQVTPIAEQPVKIERGAIRMQVAQQAVPGQPKAKKSVKTNTITGSTRYYRPDGVFYSKHDINGYGYSFHVMHHKPFVEYTWKNATGNSANWAYEVSKYDSEAKGIASDTLAFEGPELSYVSQYWFDVPSLTENGATYQILHGKQGEAGTPALCISGEAASNYLSPELSTAWCASSHFYGSSDRTQSDKYGWNIYGVDGGADNDYWFGRNHKGYTKIASAFEKPTSPYLLTNVTINPAYAVLADGVEEADLDVTVYRLPQMYPYEEDESTVVELDRDAFEVVATGKLHFDATNTGDNATLTTCPLIAEEDGLEFEVTPEIDFPILVVISGYEDEAVWDTFSLKSTSDEEDEGKGELAFLGEDVADSNITLFHGLNNFFASTSGSLEMKAGFSIFVSQWKPFLIYNYNFENGEYNFPVEGGQLVKSFAGYDFPGISFYGTKHAEEWTVTCDGADVPEWLDIQLVDVLEEGKFYGEVNATVTAQALPEGVSYREAKVKFSVPGASLVYNFSQGTSGINDVTTTIGGVKAHKVVENGQVLVVVGDKKYNMMGAEVK